MKKIILYNYNYSLMTTEYHLVNPFVGGNFTRTFSGDNTMNVAKNAWKNLSKYFNKNIPKFYFTLENTKNNKLYHFRVAEKHLRGGNVKYTIKNHAVKTSDKELNAFKKKLSEIQTKVGGKIKKKRDEDDYYDEDDDDEEDDSSSDEEEYYFPKYPRYLKNEQPIVYWWYNPLIYKVKGVYFPTLVYPLSPYMYVSLSSAVFPEP